MIGYFILGVCLLAAVLVLGRWLVNADPRKLAQILRFVGAGVLGAAALFFFLTGRFTWGLPLAFLATALLRRWAIPNLGGIGGAGGIFGGSKPRGGQASEVETEFLRMTLEHDTGTMRGTVLRGRFAGRQLADLDTDQLVELLGECHREDPESAQLLETWLDRTHGPEWREQSGDGAAGRGGGTAASGGGNMTREEAREILGVDVDATADEIREAHHRMMLKHHPDRGGSGYFAAKINQAKELLLRD